MNSLAGRRILIVLGSLELGGAERQALILAEGLARDHGATVTVAGMGNGNAVPAHCQRLGLPCRSLPRIESRFPFLTRLKCRFAARRLRRLQPQVLLPFTAPANVLCGLMRHVIGATLVFWNQRDEGVIRLPVSLEKSAVSRSDVLIANGIAGAGFLVRELGVSPADIAIVPNAVRLPAALADRATWRQRLGARNDDYLAVMVANLSPLKDHATLLGAWRQVVDAERRSGRRALLVLAGRHDAPGPVLTRIADLDLGHDVTVLGMIEDVPGLLAACDLLVHSSRSEGSPNAVLEAMAAGLPVVATDLPTIRELLGDQAQGCVAPPGDEAAWARRILTFMDDPQLRQTIGADLAERARLRHDPCRIVAQWAQLMAREPESR